MKRFVRAAGLIAFGLVVALGGFELVLRATGIGGLAQLDPTYDRPREGFVPHPDRQHPWTDGVGEVLRIAVIGDSFTVGYANQWADAYPRRLQHLLNLNAEATPAEVRVFAKSDTNTWQQLRFLEAVLEYQPDLILLAVFLNDTEDPADPEAKRLKERMLPRVPRGWKLWVLQRSRALGWIYLRLEAIRSHRAAVARQEHVFEPGYPGLKRFRRAIGIIADRSRESGIPLVAVVWPSMGGLGDGYPHRMAHERIGKILKRAGVPCLDLLPEFLDKSSQRLSAYPEIDTHPNEIGHRIGATAIFRFLLKKGYIDPSYRPRKSHLGGEIYWLSRVRRKRSPLLHTPPKRTPDTAQQTPAPPP